jgi:hypothetical protein
MSTYCLFQGRHELPENNGAICSDFDFKSFEVVKSPLWDEALSEISEGKEVSILVTGLTPALVQFLNECEGEVTLLHYDNSIRGYHKQKAGKKNDDKVLTIGEIRTLLSDMYDNLPDDNDDLIKTIKDKNKKVIKC